MALSLFFISFYQFFYLIICFYLTNSLGSFYFVYLLLANAVLSFFTLSLNPPLCTVYFLASIFIHVSLKRYLVQTILPSDHISIHVSIKQPIYIPAYLSIYLFIYASLFLSIFLSVYLSVFLSVYLSVCLPIYLPICLSVCLYIYLSKN